MISECNNLWDWNFQAQDISPNVLSEHFEWSLIFNGDHSEPQMSDMSKVEPSLGISRANRLSLRGSRIYWRWWMSAQAFEITRSWECTDDMNMNKSQWRKCPSRGAHSTLATLWRGMMSAEERRERFEQSFNWLRNYKMFWVNSDLKSDRFNSGNSKYNHVTLLPWPVPRQSRIIWLSGWKQSWIMGHRKNHDLNFGNKIPSAHYSRLSPLVANF